MTTFPFLKIFIKSKDGAETTIIDGSNYDGSTIKVNSFNNSSSVSIDGFTIRNCNSEIDQGEP